MEQKTYTPKEVEEASKVYFRGDDLAARVWSTKYALKDSFGNLFEKTPDDMHRRLAREIARIENKYPNPLSEEQLFELMGQIAAVGGEGVSGVRLIITDNGELLSAEINGKSIDKSKKYTIATLDYLAEGNDKMYALKKSVDKRTTKLSVRQLIMDAIKRESAAGRSVTAKMEGRIVIK